MQPQLFLFVSLTALSAVGMTFSAVSPVVQQTAAGVCCDSCVDCTECTDECYPGCPCCDGAAACCQSKSQSVADVERAFAACCVSGDAASANEVTKPVKSGNLLVLKRSGVHRAE